MERPPRRPHEPIVGARGLLSVVLLGLYIGVATLWLFHHFRTEHGARGVFVAQTVAFTGIILLEKMNVFNFRSLEVPMSPRRFFANRWLLAAWAGMIALQVAVVYVPRSSGRSTPSR